jgi:hypothetical protein
MKKDGMSFYVKLGILLLFVLPIAYTGIVIAVGVHEILGHGLFSEVVGMSFESFNLKIDGMGTAYSNFPEGMPEETMPKFSLFIWTLAGPAMTILFGIILISLAYIFRKKFFASLSCLILAILSILDSSPYVFWNTISPVGTGDIAKILSWYPSSTIKLSFLIIGGLIMFLSIFLINLLFFKTSQKWFGNDIIKKSSNKIILLIAFFILQLVGWFAFDWNQLIPGIGQLPNIIGVGFTAIVLGFVYFKENWKEESKEEIKWVLPTIIAWIMGIIIFLLTFFIFQYGVNL